MILFEQIETLDTFLQTLNANGWELPESIANYMPRIQTPT
jgi:hypothetical protein